MSSPDNTFKQIQKETQQLWDEMEQLRNEVRKLTKGQWKPVRIWVPRKINGRWYKPGSWVYRYFSMSPGGGYYIYGDDFDYLRSR